MRVNSAFNGFFTTRLVVGSVMMLSILFIASSFTMHSDRDLRAQQVNLIIRQIGHRLLLQSGDLTSRVMPVTEIREGTFLLTFEKEFVFSHDSLMMLTHRAFPKTEFPSGYTVLVHECLTANIVYGFQINNTSKDILACQGRSQPAGCYKIEISFPDLYKDAEQKIPIAIGTVIGQGTKELKSSKVDVRQANPVQIPVRTEELKSIKVTPRKANEVPMAIGIKTATFDYPMIPLVYGGMLVLLSVALLIGRSRKSLETARVQNQNDAILTESASVPIAIGMPVLGKFLFDLKEQRLLLGSEVISLTDKECRILELLNQNFGELIPRETLMQKVWIDEGVITGRSLDMFVSKLRKKLSSDPELRITNVHGKGYKLEREELVTSSK